MFTKNYFHTSTLLLGAADLFLRELLEQLPPFVEQCLLLPDYTDLNHYMRDTRKVKLLNFITICIKIPKPFPSTKTSLLIFNIFRKKFGLKYFPVNLQKNAKFCKSCLIFLVMFRHPKRSY